MKESDSKLLVIDADVACSSSETIKDDPVSTLCQDFLEQVKKICHKAIKTDEIQKEWSNHESRYFRKWSVRMTKGIMKIFEPNPKKIRSVKALKLGSRVEKLVKSPKEKEAILKDLHLIEAALATDQIVISRDDTTAGLLKKYQDQIPEFQKIIWLNPTKNPEAVIKWLEAGANPQDAPNQ